MERRMIFLPHLARVEKLFGEKVRLFVGGCVAGERSRLGVDLITTPCFDFLDFYDSTL